MPFLCNSSIKSLSKNRVKLFKEQKLKQGETKLANAFVLSINVNEINLSTY
jgi:3-methyladenine DNA glycosylase Mpg